MRVLAGVVSCLAALTLSGCQKSGEVPVDSRGVAAATEGPRFVLPTSVKPRSDEQRHFGIDTSRISRREASVVEAAWVDYQRVLQGNRPNCSVESGFSDGGTLVYACDGYEIVRYKTALPPPDHNSYRYGPSLDFRNGNKIERLWLIGAADLARLEATAP